MSNKPYPIKHQDEFNLSRVVFYVADTDAGKPNSSLNVGDLCWAVDSQILYVAISATSWAAIPTGNTVGNFNPGIVISGTVAVPPSINLGLTDSAPAPQSINILWPATYGILPRTQYLPDDDGTYVLNSANSGPNSIASGVYTPTLTNTTNLAASTAYECQYLRVGRTVTVSGRVDVDPTIADSTVLGISLPIASNIGGTEDCAGAAFASGIAGQGAAIRGNVASDRAEMVWVATDITNQPMFFNFSYQVQ